MHNLWKIIQDDAVRVINRVPMHLLDGKRIIITGATGLLGTHLLGSLWAAKTIHQIEVEVVAMGYSAYPSYLSSVVETEGFHFVQGDLTLNSFCKKLPPAHFIVHAATYGQPGRFLENQVKTLHLNTATTLSLFEQLLPGGAFLFMSSSEVYSGSAASPHDESHIGTTDPLHPRACYIEGKRTGEAICNAYRQKGVRAMSARLALAYGPGTKAGDKRVLNSFIERALKGSLHLADQGEAKRTYCYVRDVIEILLNILLCGKEPVYNVGGHSAISIAGLARLIGTFIDVPVSFPEVSNSTPGAPAEVLLDTSRAEREFSKNTFVPLEEGLQRTINWQRQLYSYHEPAICISMGT